MANLNIFGVPLPETNMEPEHGWLEDDCFLSGPWLHKNPRRQEWHNTLGSSAQ